MKMPSRDIYHAFLKIQDSDYVVVATWSLNSPSVFIGAFNPKLQKAKQHDPLAFGADVCAPLHGGFYPDFRYGDIHAQFFTKFPQYFWLKDVGSPGWVDLRSKGKLIPKAVPKDKNIPQVVDPCDADDFDGPDSGS